MKDMIYTQEGENTKSQVQDAEFQGAQWGLAVAEADSRHPGTFEKCIA